MIKRIEWIEQYRSYGAEKMVIQPFYYDYAPTEHKFDFENQIDQLIYQLYELTEEEIKIIEGNMQSPSGAT